jgi:hypothetical protein
LAGRIYGPEEWLGRPDEVVCFMRLFVGDRVQGIAPVLRLYPYHVKNQWQYLNLSPIFLHLSMRFTYFPHFLVLIGEGCLTDDIWSMILCPFMSG